ncbi:MAG TPA: bifunctional transaldolase/phosoglucose isomerase [Chloroflexota bacterium]|nr:bifunctional transaldolase/phosoglucose isomerase [Chloroflexota bacterium]
MANPLVELQIQGQSVWYDNIRRGLISSGELKRLIDEDGVVGVTSNPAIFEKAIGGGNEYDAQIKTLLRSSPSEIFEKLAVEDIRHAADVLAPVYKATKKRDGYISMEVWPELANDTQRSIEQARKLWQEIDKPNLMIKIPATPAGIPAIEQLISEGINVNVTLIFSIDAYRQVMDAYLKGLERRSGSLIGIASVASFFVSRVDTAVDRELETLIREKPGLAGRCQQLMGKAAIANAKVAYEAFKETFTGQRFASLKARHAALQRPLWASTGTKNPNYSDVLYVEELIGRDTVNTMPPATVIAFKDHGEVEPTLEQDLNGARRVLAQLEELGIHMETVTNVLLDEGVKLFADAFDALMSVIDAKRGALRDNIAGREQASLGELQGAVTKRLAALSKADAVRKIWQKDPAYWGQDKDQAAAALVKNRLGWLTVTETMLEHAPDLNRFAGHVNADGIKHAIFCGSSGIIAGVEAFRQAFGPQTGFPELTMLAADKASGVSSLHPETLVILAGKSATAPMVSAAYYHLRQLLPGGERYVVATDAGTELERLGREHGFRRIFLNPPDLAGNYGALSYLNLVAAAVMGVDVERVLNRAEHVVHDCVPLIQPADNAGAWFGAILGEAALSGKTIGIVCSPSISSFGPWAATIARGGGIDAQAQDVPSGPAGDRLLVYERLGAELDARMEKLRSAGQQVVSFTLRDRYDLGEEFFRWQFATAVAGGIVGANPFQPPAFH